jgi:hypothetical protein
MLQDNIVKVNKKKLQNGIKGYGISNGRGNNYSRKILILDDVGTIFFFMFSIIIMRAKKFEFQEEFG